MSACLSRLQLHVANANAVTSNRGSFVLVPVKSRLVLLLLPHHCSAPLSSSQDTKPDLFRHTQGVIYLCELLEIAVKHNLIRHCSEKCLMSTILWSLLFLHCTAMVLQSASILFHSIKEEALQRASEGQGHVWSCFLRKYVYASNKLKVIVWEDFFFLNSFLDL